MPIVLIALAYKILLSYIALKSKKKKKDTKTTNTNTPEFFLPRLREQDTI
jgi:hypothetical protein